MQKDELPDISGTKLDDQERNGQEDKTDLLVDSIVEGVLKRLFEDNRLQSLLSGSLVKYQSDSQPKENLPHGRQKNTRLQYLPMEDLIAKDNRSLLAGLRADLSIKNYLTVIEILYRELQTENVNFPIEDTSIMSFNNGNCHIRTLMRLEAFMLALVEQPTPIFLLINHREIKSTVQLEQAVTRLGREFFYVWDQKDYITQLNGTYLTSNFQILIEFLKNEFKSGRRSLTHRLHLKFDASFSSISSANDTFIRLMRFVKSGRYQPAPYAMRSKTKRFDSPVLQETIRPSYIAMNDSWRKHTLKFQDAIDYFQRYKKTNIVLYRFTIRLEGLNSKITYDQFQRFFTILNKKAVRPQGFKGYLDFLYFWREDFTTKKLFQDMVIVMEAESLMDIGKGEIGFRDIPKEFEIYVNDMLKENIEIFDNQSTYLNLSCLPIMQSSKWGVLKELIVEVGDKNKWNFFEKNILTYFIYLEFLRAPYSDEIKNRFSRGQKR